MANESDGNNAIEALNGSELSGRKMIVTVAKPREFNNSSDNPIQD
jgi:RNA recognition motif-containing protein